MNEKGNSWLGQRNPSYEILGMTGLNELAGCSKRPARLREAALAESGPARPQIACCVPPGRHRCWRVERNEST